MIPQNEVDEELISQMPQPTSWRSLSFPICFFWVSEASPKLRWKYGFWSLYPFVSLNTISPIFIFYWWKYIKPIYAISAPWFPYYLLIFYTVSMSFLWWAFFTNPGLLPFNYSITKRYPIYDKEIRNYTAVREDQIEWAKKQTRPARCVFSTRTGTFVLRADHFCTLIGTWIGLKNHRLYFNGILYFSIFEVSAFSRWSKIL